MSLLANKKNPKKIDNGHYTNIMKSIDKSKNDLT